LFIGSRSGDEEELAVHAVFIFEQVGLADLGQGHDFGDGDFVFALLIEFCELAEAFGVGLGHDVDDLDVVFIGSRGAADDSAEDAALFYQREERGGHVATDGVGDGVEVGQFGESFWIVKGDDLSGAERRGGGELRGADTSDNAGSVLFGDEDGDATDATEGSGDEDGLAALDFDGALDELGAGGDDEGEGGGVLVIHAVGNGGEDADAGDGVLGVGVIGEGHDALALGEAVGLGTGEDDFAGEIAARDPGEGDGHAVFGGAAANLFVDGIEAGGLDADEDFAVAGLGARDVGAVLEFVGTTVFKELDGFHRDKRAFMGRSFTGSWMQINPRGHGGREKSGELVEGAPRAGALEGRKSEGDEQ
jgi:hypothetical protein